MLTLDPTTLQAIVNSAKLASAKDQRWLNAIDRAATELTENPYIDRQDNHLLIASSTSNQIYEANCTCQCRAFKSGQPCWHRAASRLVQRYDEAQTRQAQRAKINARQAAAQAALDECFA
jgi:hypothetical protein